MDGLSNDRRAALSKLRELTNGADDDVAVSVLSSVNWDVQVCTSSARSLHPSYLFVD